MHLIPIFIDALDSNALILVLVGTVVPNALIPVFADALDSNALIPVLVGTLDSNALLPVLVDALDSNALIPVLVGTVVPNALLPVLVDAVVSNALLDKSILVFLSLFSFFTFIYSTRVLIRFGFRNITRLIISNRFYNFMVYDISM